MILGDFDAADVLAVDVGLVGDCAHNLPRLNAMLTTHLDAITRHAFFRRLHRAPGRPRLFTALRRVAGPFGGMGRARRVVVTLRRPRGNLGVGRHQQRRFALRPRGQCTGHIEQAHALLTHDVFEDGPERVAAATGQGVGNGLLELVHALGIHGGDRGQAHFGDRLARGLLDQPQQVLLTRRHEQDGLTAAPRPAGAADAVNVAFGVGGNVVIQHVADAVHVEAARGHIGGHGNVELAILEALDGALALGLGHVTVQCRGGESARLELFGQLGGHRLGTRENDHGVEALGFENARQCLHLVGAGHVPVALGHVGGSAGLGRNVDLDRVFEMGLGNAPHGARHGRREQGHLAGGGRAAEDDVDFFDKAHAQHFVGLVEHHGLHRIQRQGAALEVILDAPGRAHHHLHPAPQALQLRAVGLAAVDRQHPEARQVTGIALERLGDLDGQFARGRQHQHLHAGVIGPQPGDGRQREGGGLAGAGLGGAEHVAPFHQRWNGGRLNRRWRLVAHGGQPRNECGGQTQVGKSHG